MSDSFDFTSREFKIDPFPLIRKMQDAGPVIRARLPMVGNRFITTTHQATIDLLKGSDRFAMEPKNAGKRSMTWWWILLPKSARRMSKNMLTSDEPDHRRLRGLVDQVFTKRHVEGMRRDIETLADRCLDEFSARSQNNEPADFVETVARPFPLAVICEMLGIPEEDRPNLTGFFDGMLKSKSLLIIVRYLPKFYELTGYFEKLFEKVRRQPDDGMISALVHAEENGEQLSEDELLTMVYLLFVAGHETTVHLLSGSLWALARWPEECARLRDDPALMNSAVDELLRYVSPVQITKPRFVREDMEFHESKLKRGEMVFGFLMGGNYDESVFPEPWKLDLGRSPNPHLSFGGGIHHCLGFQLAKLEVSILLSKWLERFPNWELGVPVDQVLWYERFGLRAVSELPVRGRVN